MSSFTRKLVVQERVEKTNRILKYADETRKAGIYTDVCVKAGEQSFQAHRVILSCYSLYFRTMFQTNMKERYDDTVEIKGVDATSLELLIDFIYTGKVCISQENVYQLLAASDYLQIDEAKCLCFDFLSNSISFKTWFHILKLADMHQMNKLSNKALYFLIQNFAKISSTSQFKVQSKGNLLYLLSFVDSHRVDQHLVYDAIIGWSKYKNCRKSDFAEIFQCLDLSEFSSSFLTDTVLVETLVIENESCLSSVMVALAMKKQEVVSIVPSKILCIGELNNLNKIFVVHNNDQQVYPALPQGFCFRFALKLDNSIFCFGTYLKLSSLHLNQVFKMKLYEANMKWEEVASMEIKRYAVVAAVYKKGIAVTGESSFRTSKSVEFYNPSLDRWSTLPPMNESRREQALVSCHGCLFSLGGIGDDNYEINRRRPTLSSVEMLGNVNETWQHVQPMQSPREFFAAVNCMDTIYAMGGYNDKFFTLKSVEKYDFQLNQWIYVKDMIIKRRRHSACVMHDKIFVVGGKNANNQFVSEIECYDPLIDKWSVVGITNQKMYSFSLLAV